MSVLNTRAPAFSPIGPTSMPYADWKAPKQDGERLVWPAAASLPGVIEANRSILNRAAGVSIQNAPLESLRAAARAFVGHHDASPLVITGHQTELWHPGVWAKNALIDTVARATNGVAMHLAVDTDAPKHLNVRWPGYSKPITDDERLNTAAWSALIEPPTPAHLSSIEADLKNAAHAFGYTPALGDWIQSLRRATLEGISGSDLSKAIATASHELDWSLGLRYTINTLSPITRSEPWLAFVYHILARGPAFVATYNAALADYRVEQQITGATRPMPDLSVADRSIEIPFWTDELAPEPRRHRTSIEQHDGKWFLHVPYNDAALELDPGLSAEQAVQALSAFLSTHRLRISPRALTLTMFIRMLIADLFVHGIGGGRYDQITDRIIRAHFGIEPPAFAVTTATLYLPQALERERACVPCVLQAGHRLKHSLLGERKHELVSAIEKAPRNSLERASLFSTMRRELRQSAEQDERLTQWRSELESSKQRETEDATVFDREVFFALQPRERLAVMIEGYRR